MNQIGIRVSELLHMYKKNGFDMTYFLGGETADLPTQVESMVFDVAIYARTKKENIITGDVKPGDRIFGFASDGKAKWEEHFNSGIMSNGITLSRMSLMSSDYNSKFPFLSGGKKGYQGKYFINDKPELLNGMTVSEAILSPTRQWAIVIKGIIEKLKKNNKLSLLHGISMNTGGGTTKIGHVSKGIVYKKNMPKVPGIFELIHQESEEEWRDMFNDFNCGVGIDIVGQDDPFIYEVLKEVSEETGVALYDLGVCEKNNEENNKIDLSTQYGDFSYDI
jgi:phosphoribosylformylglycinamidine cyclo-ligase